MRNLHTLSLLATTTLLHAQQCDWLTSASIDYDSNPSMANEVLAGAPGFVVAARQTSGVFLYGIDLYGEAVLERLNVDDGSVQWSCTLSDSVNVESAVVSADGKAYFAGRFMGNMSLCDGSVLGGVPGQNAWYENLFLLAVDLNTGLVDWTRNLSFTHAEASGIPSLALDPQGRLWYAAAAWGTGKAVRVDATGADVEVRIVDGVRNLGTISFDPWGGLYMSGAVDDYGFAFGGQAYQDYGTTGYNMFVLRYRPDGTAGFAAFAEDITFQDPTVIATADGHAYLAGALFDPTQWGDISFGGPNWGGGVFLTKVDSSGVFLWGVENSFLENGQILGSLSRAKGPCITVDGLNRVFLMGDANGVVDWGNGVSSGNGSLMDRVQTIVAFDPSGTALWAVNSAASVGFNGSRTLTAAASPDAIHFANHARDPFTFDPFTVNTPDQQAAVFGKLSGLSTAVVEHDGAPIPHVWPIPAQAVLHVEHAGLRAVPAALFNSAGQVVRSVTLQPGRNSISIEELQTGLYLLRTAEGHSLRVVKE